jgi:hypothetical protein
MNPQQIPQCRELTGTYNRTPNSEPLMNRLFHSPQRVVWGGVHAFSVKRPESPGSDGASPYQPELRRWFQTRRRGDAFSLKQHSRPDDKKNKRNEDRRANSEELSGRFRNKKQPIFRIVR